MTSNGSRPQMRTPSVNALDALNATKTPATPVISITLLQLNCHLQLIGLLLKILNCLAKCENCKKKIKARKAAELVQRVKRYKHKLVKCKNVHKFARTHICTRMCVFIKLAQKPTRMRSRTRTLRCAGGWCTIRLLCYGLRLSARNDVRRAAPCFMPRRQAH